MYENLPPNCNRKNTVSELILTISVNMAILSSSTQNEIEGGGLEICFIIILK